MKPCRVELAEANAFVAAWHRHHKPVTGHRFSIGAQKSGRLVGVAIVGRPVARMTDQKHVAEVLRVCTDGTRNACSFLYAMAASVARQLGFKRIQTFVLASESGTSLRASGWSVSHQTDGGSWNRPSRGNRREDQPQEKKVLWYKELQ